MTPGQGNPIPSFLKREGEWIIENVAFLYRADYSVASPEASLTVVAERQDGSYARGFDSSQLSGAFGIEVTALLAANQNHTSERRTSLRGTVGTVRLPTFFGLEIATLLSPSKLIGTSKRGQLKCANHGGTYTPRSVRSDS